MPLNKCTANFIRSLTTSFILLFLLTSPASADDSMMFNALTLPDTDGKIVNMTDFKGKVVVLNFWATWCPPCIKEIPSMQRLKDQFSDKNFEIVAVAAGEDISAVNSFLTRLDKPINFPVLIDAKGISFLALGIRGLPMSFILDKEGRSVLTIMGGREWDEEAQVRAIENVLAGKPPQ